MLVQIFAAVFLFGLCVFLYEPSNYLICRMVGVQPRIFSIGYGRALWFKKIGRTIYQVTAIPLGGYVQFYGDDITKEHSQLKKGDFFSVGPWRRIALALGGPAFSLLLGVIVVFFMIAFGYQPRSNKIQLVNSRSEMPAELAGLKTGDRILAVNGRETDSYEKIGVYIGLSGKRDINLLVERDGSTFEKTVRSKTVPDNGQRYIGIRDYGSSFLSIHQDKSYPNGDKFIAGDKIISIDGRKISDIEELRDAVQASAGRDMNIKVERRAGGFFQPVGDEILTVKAQPVKTESLLLTDVYDKQTKTAVDELEIRSVDDPRFKKIFIANRNFDSFSSLKTALLSKKQSASNGKVELTIGNIAVTANVKYVDKFLLGIQTQENIIAEKADLPRDPAALVSRTIDQSIFLTESTMVGLYRIIQGKLSFRRSVSGPVKIFALAFKSVKSGWETFWIMLANITIVLGIMNLLPIPFLDGGHIVFYLVEAIYKPLPLKVIGMAVRVGLAMLLTLAVYVIIIDVWDVFFQNWP